MHSIDTKTGINCLDLYGQHQQVKKEILEAFEKVYDHAKYAVGLPDLMQF